LENRETVGRGEHNQDAVAVLLKPTDIYAQNSCKKKMLRIFFFVRKILLENVDFQESACRNMRDRQRRVWK